MDRARILGHFTGRTLNVPNELGDMSGPIGNHPTVFRQVATQRIYVLDALTYQQIACAEYQTAGLRRRTLHRHKPHRRPLRHLADRLSVGSVVLLPLHERLDVFGRISRTSWSNLAISRPQ